MHKNGNGEILISVVIPTLNRLSKVATLVRLFLEISDDQLEIIVVDDGSIDQTYETLTKIVDSRLRVFRIPNSERGAARNFGASKASGMYINYFDSDDIPHPNYLTLVKPHVIRNEPEWIVFGYDIQDETGSLCRPRLPRSGQKFIHALSTGNPFPPNSVLIRTDIALLNPFNESRDLAGSEDYELWLRLCMNYEPLYLPEISIYSLQQWRGRSVNNIQPHKAFSQCTVLLNSIDHMAWSYQALEYKRSVIGGVKMYFSLILAMSPRHRSRSLVMMLRSLILAPRLLFTKRPYAVIKVILKTLVAKHV